MNANRMVTGFFLFLYTEYSVVVNVQYFSFPIQTNRYIVPLFHAPYIFS